MKQTKSTPTEYKVTVTGRDRDGYVSSETGSFVAENLRDAKDMALSFTTLLGASVEKALNIHGRIFEFSKRDGRLIQRPDGYPDLLWWGSRRDAFWCYSWSQHADARSNPAALYRPFIC